MRRITRAEGVAIWAVGVPLAHGVVPAVLASRGVHRGWRHGRPGLVNVPGIGAIVAGGSLIAWACAAHHRAAPEGWPLRGGSPEHLLREGPYRHTRNPIYLGELTVWAGWSVLLGSLPVAAGTAALALGMRAAIAREEARLETAFGDSYRDYVAEVPRFVLRPADA